MRRAFLSFTVRTERADGSDCSETLAQLWTTKYAPTKLNDICGNKGNVEKLSRWLEAWCEIGRAHV